MYEDAAREREHLRLVLHASEWGREDEAVVVAFELRPVVMAFRMPYFLPQTFVGYELLPVHSYFSVVLS